MEDKIYLTRKDYEKYLEELKSMELKLGEVIFGKDKDSIREEEFYDLNGSEYRILKEDIKKKIEGLSRIVIIEEEKEDVINVNDIVTVKIVFNGETNIERFQLVAAKPEFGSALSKISVDSPIGSAVYNKEVGSHTYYKVQDSKIEVEILSKEKEKKLTLN